MKKIIKKALISTIPVLTGYLVLGFGFGIILKSYNYGILIAFVMSFLIYAGSMQYVAVGLMTGGASLITVALTTLRRYLNGKTDTEGQMGLRFSSNGCAGDPP